MDHFTLCEGITTFIIKGGHGRGNSTACALFGSAIPGLLPLSIDAANAMIVNMWDCLLCSILG